MNRRSNLTALMGAPIRTQSGEQDSIGKPETSQDLSADKPSTNSPAVARSGAARSMGAIWKATAAQADAAHRISADAAIELDTGLLEGSIAADRIDDTSDALFDQLVESIRDQGQLIPILVRPHPATPGRYQIAYGHRRARAAKNLGRPVHAVVRPLTDTELVLSQASENLDRTDLSYIERAFFAFNMARAGIGRSVIRSAMKADEAQISRYIKVAESIPSEILGAIGPAPKIGRPRWEEFTDRIKAGNVQVVTGAIESPGFADLPTDERFAKVFAALAPKVTAKTGRIQVWKDRAGRKIARVEETANRFNLSIDRKIEPDFGVYLIDRLDEILADFKNGKAQPSLQPNRKGDETPE